MSESLNATCAVCGERYHICNACKSVKTYKPWRTVTDSAQCYKLYLIVHDYNNGMITKEKAREMLLHISDMPKTLQPHMQKVIDGINNE